MVHTIRRDRTADDARAFTRRLDARAFEVTDDGHCDDPGDQRDDREDNEDFDHGHAACAATAEDAVNADAVSHDLAWCEARTVERVMTNPGVSLQLATNDALRAPSCPYDSRSPA